ncbi:MAG: hypothetical protein ACTSPM_13315 [Candidatus Heimdallarchaeota archaeon]
MGYEMTRPSQKWLGIGVLIGAFTLLLFTMAVPYVNHFGTDDSSFTYYTKWSGRWRSDNIAQGTFGDASQLLNFPASAPVLIGIGLLIISIGAVYVFWLTYQNKPCYFTRERPGPVGGGAVFLGGLLYLIGSLIYARWASGSPRPISGWPADKDFVPSTVRISPTFWLGIAIVIIIMAFATMNAIYYLDTVEKRPVK